MGNYVNKYFSYNNNITNETNSNEIEKKEIKKSAPKDEGTFEKDVMQTPPVIHKTLPMDPRSVTSGIDRTPIEVNCTPIGLSRRVISAIPKHLQSKPYLETDIDKVILCLTPKKRSVHKVVESSKLQTPERQSQNAEMLLTPTVNATTRRKTISAIDKERYNILGLDPRSPAADFDRTPILMPKSLERLKARSQENLHRRGSYDTDIFYPKFSYCEMSSEFNVTEIQALPDLATYAVKSLDLLNLDHDGKSNDSCSSCSSKTESLSENGDEITVIEDSESPETKNPKAFIDSDEEVFTVAEKRFEELDEIPTNTEMHNSDDVILTQDIEQIETCANDNDIIKVWRDSLVLDESAEIQKNEQVVQKRISQVPKEEVIITFDDDSIARDTLSVKLSKCDGDKPKLDTIGKKKKVSKLQDEKKVFNSNDKNINENAKFRTPLGNRSNNEHVSAPFANSPQPVFRNKGITPKMLQENTPPHKKYVQKSKLNGIQWDPDSTVII